MSEFTKPAECKIRYWQSGALIILTKNQSDVRDAATILEHRESTGDEFAKELLMRWNEYPALKQQRDDLLALCEEFMEKADRAASIIAKG